MRLVFKVLLRAVLGLVGLLLLLAAAWVACNGRWADADPRPVPPELVPQAVTLAPQENAFFDGQGLSAPDGESSNAWGQRVWRGEADETAKLLALPAGEDWTCNATKVDCVARWRASAASLAAQMMQAKVFGERCKTLAARASFQEPAPFRLDQPTSDKAIGNMALPQFAPMSACMRWLQMEAVLAPDALRAREFWARADALLRLVAGGSQTLIGHAVVWSWATKHQVLLAQWAAREPPSDVLPAAWLAPLPARVLQPRVWMASESYFQREMMAELNEHREQLFSMEPNPLTAWAGRHSLGYLPELTVQALDAYWLADLRAYGHLQGPALVRQARSEFGRAVSWWRFLHWRNTVGQILVEVGRPGFENFARRQADLVLYQAALDLSQRLNVVPAEERAGWWLRQPLDEDVRERLSLERDALVVRPWQSDSEPSRAAPVRFPLRPA